MEEGFLAIKNWLASRKVFYGKKLSFIIIWILILGIFPVSFHLGIRWKNIKKTCENGLSSIWFQLVLVEDRFILHKHDKKLKKSLDDMIVHASC